MDYLIAFKVCFTGQSGVGKSSIIKRYSNNIMEPNNPCIIDDNMTSTIGVDYVSIKNMFKLNETEKCNVKLSIWDTGGQERFNSICSIYYRDISCAIIVFDLSNPESINCIKTYIERIKAINKDNPFLLYVILGNKKDLKTNDINFNDKTRELLSGMDIDYIYNEISAKKNDNIEETFSEIINTLMNNFFKKYKINKVLKDIKDVQINNFADNTNNGMNLFKLSNKNHLYEPSHKCCFYC